MSSPIILQLNGKGHDTPDQLRRLSDRNQLLERELAALREELALVVAERDELVDALRDRTWATPDERMELLMDEELAQLRYALSRAKGEKTNPPSPRAAGRNSGQGRRCA